MSDDFDRRIEQARRLLAEQQRRILSLQSHDDARRSRLLANNLAYYILNLYAHKETSRCREKDVGRVTM
jgi:hypothetical protein